MPTLYIYSIHTVQYQERQQMLQQTVQILREIGIKSNYEVNLVFLTKPDPPMIDLKDMEARISYKPVNDAIFDANMPVLSIQQISQLLKHEAVWNKVLQNSGKNTEDLHLVLEDDVIIVEDSRDMIHKFFQSKGFSGNEWEILFLGLMSGNNPTESLGIRPTSQEYRLLPCKEAYFIKPKAAFKLKGGLTPVRFDTRVYMSYMIATQNIAAYYLNKRFTVDSSKYGFVPSTVRVNNQLILNSDAMQLEEYAKKEATDENYLVKAQLMYSKLEKLQSPNIIHAYAQCHIQAKKYKEAQSLLEQAVHILQVRKGCIGNNSQMVQDMVRIHSYTQSDLPELLSKKSKWIKVEPIQG
jgi:GR25 family glycosyltransferase involved in LPS biosynthesis